MITTFLAVPTVNIKSVHLAELRKLLHTNRENCEPQKYFWNVIVLQEKANQAWENWTASLCFCG